MSMHRLILTLLLTSAAAMRFEEFEVAFNKKYSFGERMMRRAHFEQSLQRVAAHNAGGHSWRAGINQFSDLSTRSSSRTAADAPAEVQRDEHRRRAGGDAAENNKKKTADLPPSIDWRTRGIVVRGEEPGRLRLVAGLSRRPARSRLTWRLRPARGARRASVEQQLVDCAGAFDTKGCDGGLPSHAFEYIKHAGGLSTEFSYPYHAKDEKCKFNASASVTAPQSNGIGIRVPGGSVNLTKGDEGALKYYLATKGPVSVAFDVASDFRDYKSGVYSSTVCSHDAEHVNHAVLAVGYGVDPVSAKPYWLIKNSWDYTWGDSD